MLRPSSRWGVGSAGTESRGTPPSGLVPVRRGFCTTSHATLKNCSPLGLPRGSPFQPRPSHAASSLPAGLAPGKPGWRSVRMRASRAETGFPRGKPGWGRSAMLAFNAGCLKLNASAGARPAGDAATLLPAEPILNLTTHSRLGVTGSPVSHLPPRFNCTPATRVRLHVSA